MTRDEINHRMWIRLWLFLICPCDEHRELVESKTSAHISIKSITEKEEIKFIEAIQSGEFHW